MANGGKSIVSRTNKWGFRGKNFEKQTDETRVTVYGDSNIYASFSAYDDSFVGRLEAELEARTGQGFQVINAGIPGYGPDQVLLRIEDEIPVWKPDFVIVQIFADNDFGDILRNRLFYVSNKSGELENKGIPFKEILVAYSRKFYVVKAVRALWPGLGGPRAETTDLGEETELKKILRRPEEENKAYVDRSLPSITGDHYDFDIALYPDRPTSKIKLMLMEKILGRILQTVKSQFNTPILFVILPSIKDISTNAELNYKEFEKFSEKYRRNNFVNSLEHILKKLDAHYVNLFNAYVTNGPTPYYFVLDDNHWNDCGQALAATLVAKYLMNTNNIGLGK